MCFQRKIDLTSARRNVIIHDLPNFPRCIIDTRPLYSVTIPFCPGKVAYFASVPRSATAKYCGYDSGVVEKSFRIVRPWATGYLTESKAGGWKRGWQRPLDGTLGQNFACHTLLSLSMNNTRYLARDKCSNRGIASPRAAPRNSYISPCRGSVSPHKSETDQPLSPPLVLRLFLPSCLLFSREHDRLPFVIYLTAHRYISANRRETVAQAVYP